LKQYPSIDACVKSAAVGGSAAAVIAPLLIIADAVVTTGFDSASELRHALVRAAGFGVFVGFYGLFFGLGIGALLGGPILCAMSRLGIVGTLPTLTAGALLGAALSALVSVIGSMRGPPSVQWWLLVLYFAAIGAICALVSQRRLQSALKAL
jgi:hypothetical protein